MPKVVRLAERLKLLLPHGAPWVPTLLLLETASVAVAGHPRIALEMFCTHLVQFEAEAPDWLQCELNAIAAELKMPTPFEGLRAPEAGASRFARRFIHATLPADQTTTSSCRPLLPADPVAD